VKKIVDLNPLSKLKHIIDFRLYDSGKIPNLSFIAGMESLRTFIFQGSEVVDGDMTPLLDRTWDYIFYDNKKRYSHTHQEIPALKHATYDGGVIRD